MAESVIHRLLNTLMTDHVKSAVNTLTGESMPWQLKSKLKGFVDVVNEAEREPLSHIRVRSWLQEVKNWAYNLEDILEEFVTDSFYWRPFADLAFDLLRFLLQQELEDPHRDRGSAMRVDIATCSASAFVTWLMLEGNPADDSQWNQLKNELPAGSTIRLLLKYSLAIDEYDDIPLASVFSRSVSNDEVDSLYSPWNPLKEEFSLRSPREEDLDTVHSSRTPLREKLETSASSSRGKDERATGSLRSPSKDNLDSLYSSWSRLKAELSTHSLRSPQKNKLATGSSMSRLRAMVTEIVSAFLETFGHYEHAIKAVEAQFEELHKDQPELRFNWPEEWGTTRKRVVGPFIVDERSVYGRDEDKARILEIVLKNDNQPADANIRVIPIVGEGGIGKTTLAQLVYNEPAVVDTFEIRAWVCVAGDFDVFRVSKNILESLSAPASSYHVEDLVDLQFQLKAEVAGKLFLLVLDDVCDCNYDLWQPIIAPLMGGAPGSAIIVTTRVMEVAPTIGTTLVHRLELLPDDACWSLLLDQAAFDTGDTEIAEMPASLRKAIIKRCEGLPLIAKALGGILRHIYVDYNVDSWFPSVCYYCAISSEPVLWLSYCFLPSNLKQCFAYSSIFPKGYEFKEDEVVYLWMAEGLLWETPFKQMEDTGRKLFHDLLSRAIFQPSFTDPSKFAMHDLFNDLAVTVSGKASFGLMDASNASRQEGQFKRIRHFSYISSNYDNKSIFEVLQGVDGLRTFLPIQVGASTRYITSMVLSDLLPKLKRLRVLSLRDYYITELPASIEDLRLLSYLDVSGTKIIHLPESTGSLINLQILLLRYCFRLKQLPSGIGNLIKLRHLDIVGVNLREMPSGMKSLTALCSLSNFIVGKGTGLCIGDLQGLKFLSGALHISRLENVTDVQDTSMAILVDKEDLEVLLLEWASHFDGPRNEALEYNVLKILQPHKHLKELTVQCYGGTEFPSWIGDSSFSRMVVLRLESCEKCTSLPTLGSLSSLKNLTIKGMKGIKNIGSEIYGGSCSEAFQSLETFCLEDMREWEHWELMEECETTKYFPSLHELFIVDCPKLSGRLPNHLSSLKQLMVRECARLVVSVSHFPSLEKLMIHECAELVVSFSGIPLLSEADIHGCKRMECSSLVDSKQLKSVSLSNISEFAGEAVHRFQDVKHLKIVNCEQLIDLWQNEMHHMKPPRAFHTFTSFMHLTKAPQTFHIFTSLIDLIVEDCPALTSFPHATYFSKLRKLFIVNCGALKSLLDGVKHNDCHIESLQIEGCHSLRCIVGGQLPSSLKHLSVANCEGLNCLWGDVKDTFVAPSFLSMVREKKKHTTSLSQLENLYVSNCPSLLRLSSSGELPATLKQLEIQDCSGIRTLSSRGRLPAALQHLQISGCSKLTTLSSDGQFPQELQHIDVADCPKLEAIPKSSSYNLSLEFILIRNCKILKSISDGLHDFTRVTEIYILYCPSLVSFPEEGLPDTSLRVLSIQRCKAIKALPNCTHGLNTLRRLLIWECPSIAHIPEGGFPENITSLSVADLNICEPLSQWGLQRLTALTQLHIRGCQSATSFPPEDNLMMLPALLMQLTIQEFPNLKYLSSVGFHHLRSLENLSISYCPILSSFPSGGLPSSLLQLYISDCPLLEEQCKKDRSEWSNIVYIPHVTEAAGLRVAGICYESNLTYGSSDKSNCREILIEVLKLLMSGCL